MVYTISMLFLKKRQQQKEGSIKQKAANAATEKGGKDILCCDYILSYWILY
jgi:hypothetical protein